MIERQRIATYGIATTAVATVALALWLKPWSQRSLISPAPVPPAPIVSTPTPTPTVSPTPPPPAHQEPHRIDLVFAVDTTGSMGGLLDGAKRTVWSIASHIRQADPNADLHVGLVAYRDIGDEYVTKDFQLTSDLDGVYTELSSYIAAGGGDEPEDVGAALYDAVHKMSWRGDAKKLIFLVGDAPPANRGEVPDVDVTARAAASQQIVINAIRCGAAPETQLAWQQIAKLGGGELSSIAENGGVQQVATPYDDKLAALSHSIDETTVIYGDAATHAAYDAKMGAAAAAPAAAKADRAGYYAAKPTASRAAEDIVDGVAGGTVDIGTLDHGKLPSELRGMSKDELAKELAKREADRKAARDELAKVAKDRQAYLRGHAPKGGFDKAVEDTVDRELTK